MIKFDFTEEEKYGLSQEEYKEARTYLRKHKTAGRIMQPEASKLFELYMIGYTFHEIAEQFPQYEFGRIVMTAALAKWSADRDRMSSTLRDRVKAKVVKTVLEQVDFMSLLLAVNNAENVEKMRKFIMDPSNNPKPDFCIESMKDYKEVMELFHKFLLGSAVKGKKEESALMGALEPSNDRKNVPELRTTGPKKKELSLLDQAVDEDEDEE